MTRFDVDLLDPEQPFEFDGDNLPHLLKHVYTPADIYDVYEGLPVFYEADPRGSADWLMTGQVPGDILTVPLAPPRSRSSHMARPIGIYRVGASDRETYMRDSRTLYGR
jgi:hypothetical protein